MDGLFLYERAKGIIPYKERSLPLPVARSKNLDEQGRPPDGLFLYERAEGILPYGEARCRSRVARSEDNVAQPKERLVRNEEVKV